MNALAVRVVAVLVCLGAPAGLVAHWLGEAEARLAVSAGKPAPAVAATASNTTPRASRRTPSTQPTRRRR